MAPRTQGKQDDDEAQRRFGRGFDLVDPERQREVVTRPRGLPKGRTAEESVPALPPGGKGTAAQGRERPTRGPKRR